MGDGSMTKAVSLIVLGAALALSACSKSPEQPAAQPSSQDDPEPVRPSPTPPAEASQSLPQPTVPAAGTPTPSATPSATEATAANEIPQAIRGRWGLVPKDCTSKLGDAKGLLTISAGQLKFYESVAKLGKVKEADGSRIRATFTYSGEGMTWTQDVVLDAQDGGKTLIRRDYGKDAQPGPLTYTRCT